MAAVSDRTGPARGIRVIQSTRVPEPAHAPTQGIPDRLWTTNDTARFLGICTKTVRRLIYHENLPCVRLGASVRFVPADVLAWARQREGD